MTVVDLAHAPDFRLGAVLVRPALRQVIRDGGRTEVLQPRVMQVLLVLARAEGAVVTRDELTRACWRGAVVGEDAVNRVISHLRRLAETLGEGAFRIETIPKVGYRLDRVEPVVAASPAEPAPSRRRAFWLRRPAGTAVVGLTLLLATGVGLWGAGIRWPGNGSEGPAVAIAPFEVIGGGDAARETARAVASDALGELGVNAIEAVAVTSFAAAPGSANLVLNGEVQQTPTDARVTLHLFDPKARAILWSGEVVDDPANLATLQKQAGGKAADMLICGLNAFAPEARLDAQARVLWLRTCDTWRQRGTLGQARDAMRILMQRAPSFSGAYARYALATARMISNRSLADPVAARDEARAAAIHALRLNPEESDAYVTLSVTEPATDWFAREQWLLKGLAHQPNSSDLISWRASLLAEVGRIGEVLPLARRGVELDPQSAVKAVNLAMWLSFSGQASEAAKAEQAARSTWPQSPDVLDMEFERAIRRGDATAALGRLSNPLTRPVDMLDAEALLWPKILADRRAAPSARAAMAERIVDLVKRRQFSFFWGVLALQALQQDEVAYALVSSLSKGGNAQVVPEYVAVVLFQPEMSGLRAQPRFMDAAANLGLTTYWLRSGRWPDFCSDPGLGYNCVVAARAAEKARGTR